MKKNYLYFLAAPFISFQVTAQDCSTGRYFDEVFPNFTLTSNVQYGSNVNRTGAAVDLFADIYEPDGDTQVDRPLLIVAHGGSFVGGSKTGNDVVPICEAFAKRGYVVASISYRLGMPFIVTEDDAGEAVMRATQDARAAIRFFRNSALNDGNPYNIDESKIMMCGVSAGGFMALHAAYLNDPSDIPSYIDMTATGLSGGIDGDSGTPGVSSELLAIVNIAGAIGDANWITSTSTPVLSFHGDDDDTVPYGTDVITFLGIYQLMVIDGSSTIHTHAESIGLYNCFKPHYGAGHVPHVGNATYLDTTISYMQQFLVDFACDNDPVTNTCEYMELASTEELISKTDLQVYPVPSNGWINVKSNHFLGEVKVVDVHGRLVYVENFAHQNEAAVDLRNLKSGIYIISLSDEKGHQIFRRLILE